MSTTTPKETFDRRVEGKNPLTLVLGGYSYGSLITRLLPTTESILARFGNAPDDSIEAVIRTQAWQLTLQEQDMFGPMIDGDFQDGVRRGRSLMQPRVRMSWEESLNRQPKRQERPLRRSLDSIRNVIMLRKSFDRPTLSTLPDEGPVEEDDDQRANPPVVHTHFLLISPMLTPITTLATFFTHLSFTRTSGLGREDDDGESKLTSHPTLAIFGDRDIFTSYRRLQRWAGALAARPQSQFAYRVVATAGHFWREPGVHEQLRVALHQWIHASLLQPSLFFSH